MMTKISRVLAILSLTAVAACGGKKQVQAPVVVQAPKVEAPKPLPAACFKPDAGMAAIGNANFVDGHAQFCVSDGSDQNECFTVDPAASKYEKLKTAPSAQTAAVEDASVHVETTPTEVKVCPTPDKCVTLAPKVPKSDNQLVAVANATTAVIMFGDAEAGKGSAEVWDVAKNKKLTSIKYAKGDNKCGSAKLLGETIYISASVCAGPAARGSLYSTKGKPIADVGGKKDFGTYGEVAVQVSGNTWAFLEESGSSVAIQDVVTGKLIKTISLSALWSTGDATPASDGKATALAIGNPGESTMIRGGGGKLLVIAGTPNAGSIATIDTDSGEATVVRAPVCSK